MHGVSLSKQQVFYVAARVLSIYFFIDALMYASYLPQEFFELQHSISRVRSAVKVINPSESVYFLRYYLLSFASNLFRVALLLVLATTCLRPGKRLERMILGRTNLGEEVAPSPE